MTNNHSTVLKRAVLLVSILTLSAGELMAQGTDLPPRTSPPSKLDSEPFEVHSTG